MSIERKEKNKKLEDALKSSRVQLDQRDRQVVALERRIEELEERYTRAYEDYKPSRLSFLVCCRGRKIRRQS